MSEISKNILNQIKEEKIKPKPKWQFVLVNILLVTVLITSIMLGAVVMSLVFLKIFDLDWEFVSLAGERGLPHVLEVLPVLWIVLLTMVLLLSVWLFEKTEGGYKYSPAWVVISSIFISTFFGAVLYTAKGAELVEGLLRSRLPLYEAMENYREQKFFLPEMGLLPGRLIEMINPQNMVLMGLKDNQRWEVELAPELTNKPKVRDLENGQLLLVIGQQKAGNTFYAEDLRAKHAGAMMIRFEQEMDSDDENRILALPRQPMRQIMMAQ